MFKIRNPKVLSMQIFGLYVCLSLCLCEKNLNNANPRLEQWISTHKDWDCKDDRKFFKYDEPNIKLCNLPIEVIVFRVMMYANSLLIVQAMYFTSKDQSVYYSNRGWFLKILKWRICFQWTIQIQYSFIVCRITFWQEELLLQSSTEQYFIVNKLFWVIWVKFKVQNLPIHLYSESVLHIWYLYWMNRP